MLSNSCAGVLLALPLLTLAGTPLGTGGAPLEIAPLNVHGKRSFYISPTCAGTWCPWPNQQLTWCLEADADDAAFNALWNEAWTKWVNAFGGPERSGLTTAYQGTCAADTDGRHLHVTLTTERRAGTTVGYRQPGFIEPGHEPNHGMYSGALYRFKLGC
jgi:hypothetical protein